MPLFEVTKHTYHKRVVRVTAENRSQAVMLVYMGEGEVLEDVDTGLMKVTSREVDPSEIEKERESHR